MLEENYYLTNFQSLVEFVGKTYAGLLDENELAWYRAVTGVNESAQRLYVRLSSRRATIFRISKLDKYPEIGSIQQAASELAKHGLATLDAPSDMIELLKAFTKPELVRLLNLIEQRTLPRAELEQFIIDRQSANDHITLCQADQWIRVSGLDAYTVFKLCFFGNLYQDMSEFVLRDIGVFNYEHYPIDENSRVFQSRKQLNAHLQYFACATELEEVDQSNADALLSVEAKLPDDKSYDAHLTRRVERLRNGIARQLERIDQPEKALNLYTQSDRPPSRERQVRLLMKLFNFVQAKNLCDEIIARPYASEETQFVETITPKLYKQMNLSAPRKKPFRPPVSKLTLKQSDARVEHIAKEFYDQFGKCFYVENSLINGVLGLFIWDIIFAPVHGVFYNPFQSAPADFYQTEFVEARKVLLDERFKELDDPLRFSARVWEIYEKKNGLMNPLVRWQHLNEALLTFALMRIPCSHWKALFQRILVDTRNHTSGLPDLILFPKSGSYEMLEIKGPGDAVQKNQKRWMAYFSSQRIPYRVVHIRWAKQVSSV